MFSLTVNYSDGGDSFKGVFTGTARGTFCMVLYGIF